MQDPITIQPRRPLGSGTTHVEIYLPKQVMVVFTDDQPTLIAHIASGDDQRVVRAASSTTPTSKGSRSRSKSDQRRVRHVVHARRRVQVQPAVRGQPGQSPLGGMYNPVYFNYGIAVHGAQNVPPHPASHGCIRVNMDIAEYFPTLVANGDLRLRVGSGRARARVATPSAEMQRRRSTTQNPNSTTTTSSTTTTTTVATSTTKPAPTTTTIKPATSTPPATTAAPATAAPTSAATPAATAAPPATAAPTAPPGGRLRHTLGVAPEG